MTEKITSLGLAASRSIYRQFFLICTAVQTNAHAFALFSVIQALVIIWFRIRLEINLHEWAFLKTKKYKLVPNWTRKTVWLLINDINMKKIRWKYRKIFLKAIFSHSSFYAISLALKISYFLSTNHTPVLRCVIWTGVTIFALLSTNEQLRTYTIPDIWKFLCNIEGIFISHS